MTRKSELRRIIRSRLAQFPAAALAEKSARICEAIARQSAWRQASVVCLFAPQANEPNVELLWEKIGAQKICYPRVHGSELDLLEISDPAALQISRWQLREPSRDETKIVPPEKIDLILVPGVAFSRTGGRLGRGGGFYDRLLAHPHFRAHKIGVCFEAQLAEDLPVEAHDREVGEVVTESEMLHFK